MSSLQPLEEICRDKNGREALFNFQVYPNLKRSFLGSGKSLINFYLMVYFYEISFSYLSDIPKFLTEN